VTDKEMDDGEQGQADEADLRLLLQGEEEDEAHAGINGKGDEDLKELVLRLRLGVGEVKRRMGRYRENL
jgi:hypothetical protein